MKNSGFDGASSFAWPDGRKRNGLPVDEVLPQLLAELARNRMVVVEAELGSGGSVRIPQALALAVDRPIQILRTTRAGIEATKLAIKAELGKRIGDTRMSFSTDTAFMRRLLKSDGKLGPGLLVIDDTEERGLPYELLFGLIKLQREQIRCGSIVVLAGPSNAAQIGRFLECPVLKAEVARHPIELTPAPLQPGEHHSQATARAAQRLLEEFVANDHALLLDQSRACVSAATIAVFVPGEAEAHEVSAKILAKALDLAIHHNVEIYTCGHDVTSEELARLAQPAPAGKLRFVIGTDLIASVLDPRIIVCVIDSLEARRKRADKGFTVHARKIAIARPWSNRRKALLGTCGPGRYIPTPYGNQFETLSPNWIHAIQEAPLSSVGIFLAGYGHSFGSFPFPVPPGATRVSLAIKQLVALGLLDSEQKLTKLGQSVYQLDPSDPERSAIWLQARQLGIQPEAVIATEGTENGGFFCELPESDNRIAIDESVVYRILSQVEVDTNGRWTLNEKGQACDTQTAQDLPPWIDYDGETFRVNLSASNLLQVDDVKTWLTGLVRESFAPGSNSDFARVVGAYRAFRAQQAAQASLNAATGFGVDVESMHWCRLHGIRYDRIRRTERLVQAAGNALQHAGALQSEFAAFDQKRTFDESALSRALLCGSLNAVARRLNGGSKYWAAVGRFVLDQHSACPAESEFLLTRGQTHRNIGTTRTEMQTVAEFAAPLEVGWVLEMVPAACSKSTVRSAHYQPERDEVVETRSISFLHLFELLREFKSVPPEAVQPALASWLAEHGSSVAGPLGEVFRQNANIRRDGALLTEFAQIELLPELDDRAYHSWIGSRLDTARRIREIAHPERFALSPLCVLKKFIGSQAAKQAAKQAAQLAQPSTE